MDPFRTSDSNGITSATRITSVETLAENDTLVWEGERLIVRSPRAMPSWRVGQNRKTAVHFRGTRYAIVGASEEPGRFEYVLEPWPERAHDHPSRDIRYGEHYVREREEDAGRMGRSRVEAWMAIPLWPLFGWLPSRLKGRLHVRFGFSPVTSTGFSIVIELAMLPMCLIALILPAMGVTALLVGAVLFVDAFFRLSIFVDDAYPAFGFLEWIVRPGLVTLVRRGWIATRAPGTRAGARATLRDRGGAQRV